MKGWNKSVDHLQQNNFYFLEVFSDTSLPILKVWSGNFADEILVWFF